MELPPHISEKDSCTGKKKKKGTLVKTIKKTCLGEHDFLPESTPGTFKHKVESS